MKNLKKRKINKQSGAAMLISVIFFLFISLAIISGLVSPTVREFRNASVNLNSKKSYFLAESGSEDATYRIMNNMTIGGNETITLGSNSVNTTITTLLGNIKQIVSLGDVGSLQRKTSLVLKTGEGIVFKYGTQAGEGGFEFRNGSYINGSIYSNGPIVGAPNAYITGAAYVAGSTGSISNTTGNFCIGGTVSGSSCSGSPVGDAHAHSVTNTNVTGTIYCQAAGSSGNNKSCDTSQPDPDPLDLPLSKDQIAQWKTDATNGGTPINGDLTISTPMSLGPIKIIGNLIINNTLTITGTIYVTGNITISDTVKLDSSYGSGSGILMSDGYILIANNVIFCGSIPNTTTCISTTISTPGSYILLLSDSTCDSSVSASPCNGHSAIEVLNNSSITIANAQKGTVYFKNNSSVKEAVGYKIELYNNTHFDYGSGIINPNFPSGPSGSWVVNTWQEVQ
jgi:hypothetical protein